MITWTNTAQEAWERYLAKARPQLEATGADAEEVLQDLKRHIETEAAAAGTLAITRDDLERLLGKIGAPIVPSDGCGAATAPTPTPNPTPAPLPSTDLSCEASSGSGAAPPNPTSNPSGTAPARAPKPPSWLLFVFGAVLPAFTLGFEFLTRMCAEGFFDPIPTIPHALLVFLVPLANALGYYACREGRVSWRNWLGWLNGAAIGVGIVYSILYLPLMVPGVIAVIFFGMGLLPWTPAISLIASIRMRRHLRRLGQEPGPRGLPGLVRGLALGLGALVLLQVPMWYTRYHMVRATSEDAATRESSIRSLHRWGSEDVMLRACYAGGRGMDFSDIMNLVLPNSGHVESDQARTIFYRATGRAFNEQQAPPLRAARAGRSPTSDWSWDTDQGGDKVGARVRGLTLNSSRLDAVLYPEAEVAYTEWTMEFKNISPLQREARAQIQLPPGGVVSRLTLWVNGEEREAAFAGRSQVREAYQHVAIQQRRDPVLVTTTGPDRIQMQCFPVPPTGGVMRIRVGITVPLVATASKQGVLCWPHFLERNFTIPSELRHAVWAESPVATHASGGNGLREEGREGRFDIRGELTESALADNTSQLVTELPEPGTLLRATDQRPNHVVTISQQRVERAKAPPGRVAFVVDTSEGMKPYLAGISKALRQVPAGTAVGLFLTEPTPEIGRGDPTAYPPKADPAWKENLASRVEHAQVWGGQDNSTVLRSAWEAASEGNQGGIVVWIHGPQPVALGSADALHQALERRPDGAVLLDFPVTHAPNRILDALDRFPAVRAALRLGSFDSDLEALVAGWRANAREWTTIRKQESEGSSLGREAGKGARHLVRLWARDESERLRARREPAKAVETAAAFQLVTPLSGAVVLETAAQYQREGLEPVSPETVPAIPEPGTWAMLVTGLAAIWLMRRRKIRTGARAAQG